MVYKKIIASSFLIFIFSSYHDSSALSHYSSAVIDSNAHLSTTNQFLNRKLKINPSLLGLSLFDYFRHNVASFSDSTKIVYLNSDEILRSEGSEARNKKIYKIGFDEAFLSLPDQTLDGLREYAEMGINLALPPMPIDGYRGGSVCFVVLKEPKADRRAYNFDLFDWEKYKEKVEFQGKKFNQKNLLTNSEASLLTFAHESFHCFDKTFWKLVTRDKFDVTSERYQSEAFAEAAALLYLNTLGLNLVKKRMAYRLLGSLMDGRYKNPYADNSHVSYSFYPVFQAVLKNIESGKSPTTIDEVIATAKKIVEDNPLTSPQEVAIFSLQTRPEGFWRDIEKNTQSETKAQLKDHYKKIEVKAKEYQKVIDWAFDFIFMKK